jgi:hypothetical protein
MDKMTKNRSLLACALLALVTAAPAAASGLEKGTPDLKSAGPLAFGPNGILFVGDTNGAALFAIDTSDRGTSAKGTLKVDSVNRKIAEALGTEPGQIMINDLAINPTSGKAYLSVSRGKGPTATPVIVRIDSAGKVEPLNLENIEFAKAALPAPPASSSRSRSEAITDLAYIDGRVFVAGLSNEEFSSRLLAIPYPFGDPGKGTSIEIYHGAHGRLETTSPVRTFAPYTIKGEPYLMAAYTCTPLVKLPVAALKPGSHYKGTTVAELGNRNKPLDMIVYQKDGKDYILLANSSRGMMKIKTDGIESAPSISKRVSDKEGQTYDTIAELKGVEQLDALDATRAVVLLKTADGSMNLETIDLP